MSNACAVSTKQHLCQFNNLFNVKFREPIANTTIHTSIHTLSLQLCSFVFPENFPIEVSMYVLQYLALCDAVTWNISHQHLYTHLKDRRRDQMRVSGGKAFARNSRQITQQ